MYAEFGQAGIQDVGQIVPYTKYADLGSATISWRRVYATKLNNGADIEIPTQGGTLARLEDIQEAIGAIETALAEV